MSLGAGSDRVVIMGHSPCQTPTELFRSETFQRILVKYLRRLDERESPLLLPLEPFRLAAGQVSPATGSAFDIAQITEFLIALAGCRADELPALSPSFRTPLQESLVLNDFVVGLYSFWRSHERFVIVEGESILPGVMQARHRSLIRLNETIKNLILETYRYIGANLTGSFPRVFRQLPAGAGVSMLLEQVPWDVPSGPYQVLSAIPFIQKVVIEPPLVYYPKRNLRKGAFAPAPGNPLQGADLNPRDWMCYPAKVGELVVFIYFHRDYLSHGSSLANLFDFADRAEIKGQRPDAILVFGLPQETLGEELTGYYQDSANGLLVGAVARRDEVDYFGYFKKMALTLHNLIMIDRGHLPIHGAMARIILRSGRSANVVLVGDSGAGKSESLEAFRVLADKHIRHLTVIFDDMGSLRISDSGRVEGLGTEIGAFVRLDDLEPGFAYAEIERAIFMNPHKANARLVIPMTPYREVIHGYPVDLFLYANNYERVGEDTPYIELLPDSRTAHRVFSEGLRQAKGTTDEHGLVSTYFANPFGAPQKREQHDALAKAYLDKMLEGGTKVGQIRTQLGISGYELGGPEAAARALFDFITANGS
jgi:hypothetical protein